MHIRDLFNAGLDLVCSAIWKLSGGKLDKQLEQVMGVVASQTLVGEGLLHGMDQRQPGYTVPCGEFEEKLRPWLIQVLRSQGIDPPEFKDFGMVSPQTWIRHVLQENQLKNGPLAQALERMFTAMDRLERTMGSLKPVPLQLMDFLGSNEQYFPYEIQCDNFAREVGYWLERRANAALLPSGAWDAFMAGKSRQIESAAAALP